MDRDFEAVKEEFSNKLSIEDEVIVCYLDGTQAKHKVVDKQFNSNGVAEYILKNVEGD